MKVSDFYTIFVQQEGKFTTDSRHITKGCIFFALKGENFNGNIFAPKALENGAAYVVVDEDILPNDDTAILVPNVLFFMQQLAHYHRRCFDIPVISIAGSNGKTTTKNLLYEVLNSHFKTHCTQGNFNNHIGVPITLLQIPNDCEVAIIEIGTNSPGEVETLSKMVAPTHGLITNIGKEHLEGFGSLEAIAHEESQLYRYLLENDGFAFVNHDDEMLYRMSKRLKDVVYYSKSLVAIHSLVPQVSFTWEETLFSSVLMGDYNLDNILAAITVGHYLDIPKQKIVSAICNYVPSFNRSQIIKKETNQFWLDAYNANPSSMEKALKAFSELQGMNKIVLLGDMFELGDHSALEHENVLHYALSLGFETIFTIGEHFFRTPIEVIKKFKTADELGQFLIQQNHTNTAFFIKGSRGVKMEKVMEYFS